MTEKTMSKHSNSSFCLLFALWGLKHKRTNKRKKTVHFPEVHPSLLKGQNNPSQQNKVCKTLYTTTVRRQQGKEQRRVLSYIAAVMSLLTLKSYKRKLIILNKSWEQNNWSKSIKLSGQKLTITRWNISVSAETVFAHEWKDIFFLQMLEKEPKAVFLHD